MDLRPFQWRPGKGWDQPLAMSGAGDTMVLAFGGPQLIDDPAPLRELAEAFPAAVLIGCSTAGEILGDMIFDQSLTATVARFDSTRVTIASHPVPRPEESYHAGVELGRRLTRQLPDLTAVFVLADGLGVNAAALTKGLVQGTRGRAAISGGLAGDGIRFDRSWVLVDGEPRSGHAVAVGLTGPGLRVGHGIGGGWEPFGPTRRVTGSAGNVLRSLDGAPALELYKRYLGERAAGLPATALLFPLSVRQDVDVEHEVIRAVIGVDEQTQTLTLAGEIPEGCNVQLMRGTVGSLVRAARRAAQDSLVACEGPTLMVAVSCVGRRIMLGRHTEDELEAPLSYLPPGSELVGFYSYGEIASSGAGRCDLLNQTMTITTIAETS